MANKNFGKGRVEFMSLAFAPIGREMTVTKINADEKVKRHLENLGFIAGSCVTAVMDSRGDLIVRILDSKIAINRALAMKIMVA